MHSLDRECNLCGVPDQEWVFRDPFDKLRWVMRELGDKAPWIPFEIEYTKIGPSGYCKTCRESMAIKKLEKQRRKREPK